VHKNVNNRSQFHQYYAHKFFVRIFWHSQNVTRKSCQNDIRTKYFYVKHWWNWHQESISSTSDMCIFRTKVLRVAFFYIHVTREKQPNRLLYEKGTHKMFMRFLRPISDYEMFIYIWVSQLGFRDSFVNFELL